MSSRSSIYPDSLSLDHPCACPIPISTHIPIFYEQTNRDKSCLQDLDTYGGYCYWNYRVAMPGYDILEATPKPPKTWKYHWRREVVGKVYSYLFAQYPAADLSTSSQFSLASEPVLIYQHIMGQEIKFTKEIQTTIYPPNNSPKLLLALLLCLLPHKGSNSPCSPPHLIKMSCLTEAVSCLFSPSSPLPEVS